MTSGEIGLIESGGRRDSGAAYGLWAALYLAALGLALNVWVTQTLAAAAHYRPWLGEPVLGRLYWPWAWHAWRGPFFAQARWEYLKTWGLAALGGFLSGLVGLRVIAFLCRRSRAVSILHGSARWANRREVMDSSLIPPPGGKGEGVYVGAWEDGNAVRYLRHGGPEHVLAFAPTRSGKGIGLVVPTLLGWEESVVVYDLKGENWALTAGYRKRAGQKVLKFDPMDTEGIAARWNPLREVRLRTLHEVSDVQNIVQMVVDPDGKGLREHWDKTSLMFLVGVVLYVLYEAEKKGRCGTLGDVAATMTSAAGIDQLYTVMRDYRLKDGDVHEAIARSAIDMMEKDPRERTGVLSTAKTFFLLYVDPIVSANVAESDFRVRDLMHREEPVSLYIVVDPANKDRLKPLTRLLLAQIVRGLTPRLEFEDGAPKVAYKHRLLLLLDEFPALGRIPIFEEALAHIAGYGLKAYLFVQDLGQLRASYGKEEAIFANCQIRVAYTPNTVETAELLSKMAGTTTVIKRVVSTSGKRIGLFLGQATESLQEFARPLLTADECMRLPSARKDRNGRVVKAGRMLVFVAGHRPIYGRQILFFEDPTFLARSRIEAPRASDALV